MRVSACVGEHGRRGFWVLQPARYTQEALGVLVMTGCKSRSAPGRNQIEAEGKHVDNATAAFSAEEHPNNARELASSST